MLDVASVIGCLLFLLCGFFEVGGDLTLWGLPLFYLLSYLCGGWHASIHAISHLFKAKIDVDFLMVLASLGAAYLGEWDEGAILLFLFSLSHLLQHYSLDRSRNAIASLVSLRPEKVLVIRGNEQMECEVEKVVVGDRIAVHPGERLALDGVVVQGSSSVDESALTGESALVLKGVGSEVFSGTLNSSGYLEYEVSKEEKDSTLSEIVRLVRKAQKNNSKTQSRIEVFEQYYAMTVIGIVVFGIFAVPSLFSVDFGENLYRFLVLLVVASPCALVLSMPVANLSAIARAARRGILLKGGRSLEKIAEVSLLATDKTGTLTTGEFVLHEVALCSPESTMEDFFSLVGSIESGSEHPIAVAIKDRVDELGLVVHSPEKVKGIAGKGVWARVEGHSYLVGNQKILEEHGVDQLPEKIARFSATEEKKGLTLAFVYDLDREIFLGAFSVGDTVRDSAKPSLEALSSLGLKRVVMMSGDLQSVADKVASQLGIKEAYGSLFPCGKVELIKKFSESGERVAMIGDGVNDAPALVVADVGIAMGVAGTDVALESADIVLMTNDLRRLVDAFEIGQKSQKIIRQNLIFSLLVILVLVVANFLPGFQLPMPVGVVAHEGSTILVVLNGLRLLWS